MRLAGTARTVSRPLSGERLIQPEALPCFRRLSHQKERDRLFAAPTANALESAPLTKWIDHEQPESVQVNLAQTPRISERRDLEDRGGKLPVLFRYITSKYGTPVEQLLHLSSSGCFKSVSVESSGRGDGSVIYFPLEANIILPTPSHVVNTSSLTMLSPLKLQGTKSSLNLVPEICPGQWSSVEAKVCPGQWSSVEAEVCPGQWNSVEASRGQLKEEAHVGVNSQTLHFESRFEGGNLQQAIEM